MLADQIQERGQVFRLVLGQDEIGVLGVAQGQDISLFVAGSTIIMRQFDVDKTMDLLQGGVTVMFGVPAIYLFLSQHPRFDAADFSKVRSWGCAGARIPQG